MQPPPIRHEIRTERALAAHVSPSLLRLALEDRRWHRVTHWSATPAEPGQLGADLRSWPPGWRYRVADLEADGLTRDAAVRQARQESFARTQQAA